MPSHYALNSYHPESKWPGVFSSSYVETCALFGSMVEVRTGRHSQQLPVWVRMLDKFSTWGLDNGLKSMVTTLLQFGLVGHPFVLPDMVGGNGYGEGLPSRELYIRWMQVNVFMPAIQISFVPWMYDDQVAEHVLDVQLQDKNMKRQNLAGCGARTDADPTPRNTRTHDPRARPAGR